MIANHKKVRRRGQAPLVMEKFKVSLILPSLNVKAYMEECLSSAVAQTLQEIEIICVDAGSDDGTLEIIEKYMQRDERIKLLKSNKRSYGHQVNLGMDNARGRYVAIVETDDVVPADMYERLYVAAEQHQLDFVKADFQRFKDTEQGRKYWTEHLTDDDSCYDCVLSPRDDKKIFRLLINTWNGIYNRDFLRRYHIRHHESPGAAYQDNGFWFQTMIFARRVMFMREPKYLNRRDNPNSSVHNRGQIFAMADEYRFIRDILVAHPSEAECFWPEMVRQMFLSYLFNLMRLPYLGRKIFLTRMEDDFKEIMAEKLFPTEQFMDYELGFLFRMVFDRCKFCKMYIDPWLDLYNEMQESKQALIYGAGKYGQRFCAGVERNLPCMDNVCFAVSNPEDNPDSVRKLPVKSIREVDTQNSLVVVAMNEKNAREARQTLKELGFRNIRSIPEAFVLFKDKE